jgi:hypothetical protein
VSTAANYVVGAASQSALTLSTTSSTFALSPANTVTLGTTGGTTGGVVTYVVSGTANTANCSVVGAVLTYSSGGSCTVTATMAGTTNYNAVATSPTIFSVIPATSSTTLGESPNSSSYGGSVTLTATTTTGATGTVNFEVGGASIANCGAVTISSGSAQCVTTALPEGSDSLEAFYSGDGNFNLSHSATVSYSVAQAAQSPLTVTTVAGTIGVDLTLATTGGSGSGAVTYVVANGSATCTQPSPGLVHASGAGTCLVTAFKAADGDYTSVSSTATTVTFSENQTIVFTSTAPGTSTVSSTYTPTATSSANLTVSITIDASSAQVCSIAAGVVTFTAPGSCAIDANQGGAGNILAATQIQQTITVNPPAHRNAPSAPQNVDGVNTATGVVVSWSPPVSSGSSVITGYDVTVSPGGATCTSATTSCQLPGLTAGGVYTIAVVAVSATGDSPAGSATFTFNSTTPSIPTDVTVADEGGTVVVSWHPPTGSSAVTVAGYLVTLEPGGQRCRTTTGTTCSLRGVPLSSEYTADVTVIAASGAALGSATSRTSVGVVTLAHFAFASFVLTATDRHELGLVATMIARSKIHELSLFGFTDDVGDHSYNQVLSEDRARAVGRYLMTQLARRGYHALSIRETGEGILRVGDSRAGNRKVTALL